MKMRLFSASGSRKSKYICTLGCLLCDRCGSLNRAIQGLTGPRYRPRCQDSDLKFQLLSELESKHATRDIRKSTLPLTGHISHVASFLKVAAVWEVAFPLFRVFSLSVSVSHQCHSASTSPRLWFPKHLDKSFPTILALV